MTDEDPRVWVVAKALFDEANCVGTHPRDYRHQAGVVLAALDAASGRSEQLASDDARQVFASDDDVAPWTITRHGDDFLVNLPLESAFLSRIDAMKLINALMRSVWLEES